jgi:hypothetical protein
MLVHCPHCQRSFDAAQDAAAPMGCGECRRNIQSFKWLVRDAAGVTTVYNTIALLKIGILANAVAAEDELSKAGRRWLPIASIPELARLFQSPGGDEVYGADAPTVAEITPPLLAEDGDLVTPLSGVSQGASQSTTTALTEAPQAATPAAPSLDGLFADGESFVGEQTRRWPWLLLLLGLGLGAGAWFLLWGPGASGPAVAPLGSAPEHATKGLVSPTLAPTLASVEIRDADTVVPVVPVENTETVDEAPDGAGDAKAPSLDAQAGETSGDAQAEGVVAAKAPPESAARRMARLALGATEPAGAAPPGTSSTPGAKALAPDAPKSAPATKRKAKRKPRPEDDLMDEDTRSFDSWMKEGDRLLASAPSKALNAYIHAYSLDPWGPRVLTRLGDAYRRLADYERAVSHYQRATGKHPQYAPAYVGLGQALIAKGDKAEARRVLDFYMRRFPDGSQRARVSAMLQQLGAP